MEFLNIDPIALKIGPIEIRWYALSYITGLLLGWRYCVYLTRFPPKAVTPPQLDDFLVWATIGIVLGGRLGYVIFYQPLYFLEHPLEILKVWKGGMSFHGGLLGLILGAYVFARRHSIPILRLFDLISAVGPIGLFFGRIANFINGELWGRTTDVPWGFIFPRGGPLPRHPSQLYEAYEAAAARLAEHARIIAETVREPDAHIGFLIGGTTWGQWLSVPMILFGLYMVRRAMRQSAVASK